MKKILFLALIFSFPCHAEQSNDLVIDVTTGQQKYVVTEKIFPPRKIQPEEVPAIKTVTEDITIQYEKTVLANAFNGKININLKQCSTLYNGQEYLIKKIDSSTNTVTIYPYETETIDGNYEIIISSKNESIRIQTDQQNWYIISN